MMQSQERYPLRFGVVKTALITLGLVFVFETIWAYATGRTLPTRSGLSRVAGAEEPLKFFLTGIPILYIGWTWDKLRARFKRKPIQPPQHNAGSRPSSGDPSASDTPSSLGPRGSS